MIVYQKSKADFLDDAFKRDIEAVILAEFTFRTGKKVAQAEIRSWKESLMSVAKVLNDEDSRSTNTYGTCRVLALRKLSRVRRVSVETQRIVGEMKSARR